MKIQGCLVTAGAEIFCFAMAALLLGCGAGFSTAGNQTTTPPPATHIVNLSWTASTSSDVSGYNIYRAPYTSSCGDFTRINAAPQPGTRYTDSVPGGAAYCYATTAVNTSNQESGYSNIVSNLQIPSP